MYNKIGQFVMGDGTASKKLKMYTKQRIGTSDPKSNFIPPLLARNVSISDPAEKYQDRSVQSKVKIPICCWAKAHLELENDERKNSLNLLLGHLHSPPPPNSVDIIRNWLKIFSVSLFGEKDNCVSKPIEIWHCE